MPKRSVLWSNGAAIRSLDRGKWVKKKAAKKNSGQSKKDSGVLRYRNKKGKACCHGTARLKESQPLAEFRKEYMASVGIVRYIACVFMGMRTPTCQIVVKDSSFIGYLCLQLVIQAHQ